MPNVRFGFAIVTVMLVSYSVMGFDNSFSKDSAITHDSWFTLEMISDSKEFDRWSRK